MTTPQQKAYRETLALLTRRVEETDHEVVHDIAFAVRALKEAEISKRYEMLEDLQTKADAAESTHDPEVVSNLLTALKAFLGEEMDEEAAGDATNGNGEDQMAQENDGLEERRGRAEADDFAKYAQTDDVPSPEDQLPVDASGQSRQKAAEMDGFMRYAEDAEAATEAHTVKCEACGYEMALPMETAEAVTAEGSAAEEASAAEAGEEGVAEATRRESAPPATPVTVRTLKEAQQMITTLQQHIADIKKPVPKPADLHRLSEADRTELVTLRAREAYRDKLQKAVKAIEESGTYLEPKHLMSFTESQWPAILDAAAPPPRSYGTGEIAMPVPGRPRPQASARETFEALIQRSN